MADALGEFQMYPRGFLGRSLGPRVEKAPKPFQDLRNGLRYDMSIFEPKSDEVSYNHSVQGLWAKLLKGEARISNMDFRKQILEEALVSFGTKDFFSWYRVQRFSQLYGANQRDFLEDTIRFLSTGKRSVSIQNWHALLTLGETEDIAREEEREIVKEFFNLDVYDRPYVGQVNQNSDLLHVICTWMSIPNGDEDLLGTLQILFGNN